MPGIHQPGANGQEQDALRRILCAEFGDRHVQSGLADRVRGRVGHAQGPDQFDVRVGTGEGDDFLRGPLQDQRGEQVEEVDLGDDVGLEVLEQVVLQLRDLFASVCLLGMVVSGISIEGGGRGETEIVERIGKGGE